MIGERPNNEEFGKLFDWPDAVVHLPYGSSNIQAIIKDLDEQPERQEKIRRTNVVGALTKHDWLYRWETVLRTVGLEPMPGFHQRKERLGKLAKAAWSNEAIWRQTRATRNALRYEKRAG
jgi:hypothetical protein